MSWILVFVTVIGLSAGQVLFKLGATRVNENADAGVIAWFNAPLVAAVLLYALCTVAWIAALRALPLRVAYPAVALCYTIVPLLCHFFLRESLTVRTMLGSVIIVLGVVIASYSAE